MKTCPRVGKKHSNQSPATTLVIIFVGMVLNTASLAADWKSSSRLELQTIYNDNLQLTNLPHKSVKGTITDLSFGVTATTESSELSVKPSTRIERFDTEELLDNDVQKVPLRYTALTGRSQTTLKLDYSRDTTLTSELEDTGIVDTNKRRVNWNVEPSILYTLNERNNASFGLGFTKVSFQDAEMTNLVGYTAPSIYAGHIFGFSDTGKLSTTLFGSRQDAPNLHYGSGQNMVFVHNVTDDYGLQVKIENKLTELVSYSFQVSGHKTSTELRYMEQTFLTDTQTGRLVGGDISRTGEYVNWKLAIDNSIQPSSAGVLVKRNTILLNANKSFRRTFSGAVSMSTNLNKEIGSNSLFQNWEYRRASVALYWRLKRQWNMNSRYDYYWRKYDNSEAIAESNRVMFSISYVSN